ncbi:hypothetical protein JG688_00012521 [Phytophthora aleatoria]|uniref:HTH psq-type domain-containing protein n=1 Tax=Phytophthora aleatoria TaxID=2496075 RepID=A0A8J5IK80_9STRA|nr:hypothetical protein JG688_00012521 [Phytophthora aleatoria]
MAPSDHPHNSLFVIQGQPDSPLVRSEYHMYLHPRQPFVRYEHRRRHPNSRIPTQGHVDRLPGVASLLRRHSAMQARGLVASVRDPAYELEQRHSTDTDNTFEYWTPSRHTESPNAAFSPDSERMPLTTVGGRNRSKFESKSTDQIPEYRVEESKTSSPVMRAPELVRPKTSRYLREIDRRRILMRIAQGEKQSALAKEYHVSRAAICNLNKHRAEVLSRNHEHPLAKHPKRRMLAKTKR